MGSVLSVSELVPFAEDRLDFVLACEESDRVFDHLLLILYPIQHHESFFFVFAHFQELVNANYEYTRKDDS